VFVNDEKQVCMELRMGQFTATLPLPNKMAGMTPDEMQPFFDEVVPVMTENLMKMNADHRRKLKRRAARA
jgi:hypothetical protein